MHLDDDDRAALARACARRFPGADDQHRIARAASLGGEPTNPGDASAAWESLLRAADAAGKLPQLAAELARAAPTDETFTALARTLGAISAPERRVFPLLAGGAAVGALAIVVGFGVAWLRDDSAAPSTTKVATPRVAAPVIEPAVDAAQPAAAEPPTPPPPTTPIPAEASAPPAPKRPPVASTEPTGGTLPVGCVGAPSGEIVGYWYAGTRAPGAQGDTIVLDRDARVRKDYPRRDNGNNPALPERCVLPRGTKVVLVNAPIDASNGHYWVPLVAP